MKKLISFYLCLFFFGAFSSCEPDENYSNNSLIINSSYINKQDYLNQEIFNTIKQNNPMFYEELSKADFKTYEENGNKTIYATLDSGYFVDDSEIIVFTEIDKSNSKAIIHDFTSNIKSEIVLNVNSEGYFNSVDENSLLQNVLYTNNNNKRSCSDQAGFASCYAVVLIGAIAIAASDGPLPFMDTLAVTAFLAGVTQCTVSYCR